MSQDDISALAFVHAGEDPVLTQLGFVIAEIAANAGFCPAGYSRTRRDCPEPLVGAGTHYRHAMGM